MKAAIYSRVSTEGQANDGFSISAQINEMTAYCVKNDIEIFESYSDEGISGTKEDRPAFQKMIADAEKGKFNVILVHKYDRFARSIEISQRIKNKLRKASVHVISITEPIEDSPIGFFQEGLLELLSEYFVKNLSKEVKKGQKERAMQGLHSGSVPFGYRTKNSVVTIVPEEAEIVKLIYDKYLQGWGYSKIAKYLNDSGIKTLTGKYWQHHQVDRILLNPTYAGKILLNGVTYESKMPTILDWETYETAQRDRGIKGARYTYRTDRQSQHLLLGLLRCGECGCAMRVYSCGKKNDSGYVYNGYVCNMAARYSMDFKCKSIKHYSCKKLEAIIINNLKNMAKKTKIEHTPPQQVKIEDILSNQVEKLRKELDRAKAAYLASIFSLEEYSELKNKIENNIREMSSTPPPQQIDIKEKIVNMLKEFESYPEEDVINRKRILKKLIKHITIDKAGHVYFQFY